MFDDWKSNIMPRETHTEEINSEVANTVDRYQFSLGQQSRGIPKRRYYGTPTHRSLEDTQQ